MELREHVLNHVLQTITFFLFYKKYLRVVTVTHQFRSNGNVFLKHSLISLFW